jgi:hypothetical protein
MDVSGARGDPRLRFCTHRPTHKQLSILFYAAFSRRGLQKPTGAEEVLALPICIRTPTTNFYLTYQLLNEMIRYAAAINF